MELGLGTQEEVTLQVSFAILYPVCKTAELKLHDFVLKIFPLTPLDVLLQPTGFGECEECTEHGESPPNWQ